MAAIKSDGGSSGYYKLEIVNRATGEKFQCEMGDVIASVFGNDFDMGNIAKAMRRIYMDSLGQGKEGNDALYDANKCVYFSNVLVQRAKLDQKERVIALPPMLQHIGINVAHKTGAPN